MRWVFLLVVSLGLLMIGLDNSILYTALPRLSDELSATPEQSLWIINAYPLVMSGLLLGTGTLGDRIGHTKMFTIGLSIFGLASLLAAYSPTAGVLIAARALLGVGAATMMPSTLALIRQTFRDERERNTAIGIWGAVAIVGAAAGPVLGGFLLEHFFWGSVFLVNVPIVMIALVLMTVTAPPNIPYPAARWDGWSSLIALAMFSLLTLALKGHLLALPGAILAAWLFARRQRGLEQPLLTFDIFRSPMFSGGVIAAWCSYFIVASVELLTTQRFQLVAGFSPLEAGLVIVAVVVASLPTSILGGMFLHKVGFLPLISGGFVVAAIGLAVAVSSLDNLAVFVPALGLTGAGLGAVMSVASTAIIGSVAPRRAGMAASVEEVSYEFGALVAVAVMGTGLTTITARLTAGGTPEAHAFDTAYLALLGAAGAIAVLAAVVTWWCFRGNPKTTPMNQQ